MGQKEDETTELVDIDVFEDLNKTEKKDLIDLVSGYKKFLDYGKTPQRVVEKAVEMSSFSIKL